MLNSTLLEMLKKTGRDDFRRLEDFINSPFYNKREIISIFFSYLKNYYPDFESKELEKEVVWEFLFPGRKYNYGIMKNLIHDLTKMTEQFYAVRVFSKNEKQKFSSMMEYLIDNDMSNIFLYKYKTFETHFRKSEPLYPEYYKDFIEMKWKRVTVSYLKEGTSSEDEIISIADMTALNFIIQFFEVYNSIFVVENDYNKKAGSEIIKIFSEILFEGKNIDRILTYLRGKSERDYLFLKVCLEMTQSLLSPDDKEKYFEFKTILLDNLKLFSAKAKKEMLAGLNSTLDNLKDAVNVNKQEECFEIMQCLVRENIFEEPNGMVQIALFNLAVKTSAYTKNPEFLGMLIKKYIPKLPLELRENAEIFGMSFFLFANNEFKKANEYISLINFDTFPMKFVVKNLQLINAYELNDFDSFTYLQDSYKHFLYRNKSVETLYRESNLKFISYIDRLFRLRQLKNDFEIEHLEKQLLEDHVVNKHWLTDKINEMKKVKTLT